MPSDEEINAAIRDCLDRLEPGRSPILHVAEHMERLRSDGSWSNDEIKKVELGVLRLLKKLI